MEKYNPGKIVKLWDYLVELHRENPRAFEVDGKYLREIVRRNRWSALDDPSQCPSCQASMVQYRYEVNYVAIKLVKEMAKVVERKLHEGLSFNEANKVKVHDDLNVSYGIKSYTTTTRQLGLIAKVKDDDGKHDHKAGWLITKRGWDLLRGEEIPKGVVCFRNTIVERSEETTTMAEVLAKKDERHDPSEWVDIASIAGGSLS